MMTKEKILLHDTLFISINSYWKLATLSKQQWIILKNKQWSFGRSEFFNNRIIKTCRNLIFNSNKKIEIEVATNAAYFELGSRNRFLCIIDINTTSTHNVNEKSKKKDEMLLQWNSIHQLTTYYISFLLTFVFVSAFLSSHSFCLSLCYFKEMNYEMT